MVETVFALHKGQITEMPTLPTESGIPETPRPERVVDPNGIEVNMLPLFLGDLPIYGKGVWWSWPVLHTSACWIMLVTCASGGEKGWT